MISIFFNRIGGVMASMRALSLVYREFKARSGQIKDYTIEICCFSTKQSAGIKPIGPIAPNWGPHLRDPVLGLYILGCSSTDINT